MTAAIRALVWQAPDAEGIAHLYSGLPHTEPVCGLAGRAVAERHAYPARAKCTRCLAIETNSAKSTGRHV